MAQKPHPHKETFNNKVQIYRLNIINKFKPIINNGSLFVSLLSGIHPICIPTFPFDLPTQSGTCIYVYPLYCHKLLSYPT